MITARSAQLYRNTAQAWTPPAPTGTGVTYYVKPASQGGSDAANGTSLATAWATLAHADGVTKNAGSVIRVQPGTYTANTTAFPYFATAGSPAYHTIWFSEKLHKAKLIHGTDSYLNGNDAMGVWLRGNYQEFWGFEVDGTGATSANGAIWSKGIFLGSSAGGISVQYCIAHDILNTTTDYNAYNGGTNTNGGGGIETDTYYGMATATINGCIIYNVGLSGQDSSLIHALYMACPGTYTNNLVYNSTDGITSYHAFTNANVLNNTVYNVGHSGIYIAASGGTTADNCAVKNNIIHTTLNHGIIETGSTGVNNVYANNTCYNCAVDSLVLQNGLTATNQLSGAPTFANLAGLDFHQAHSSTSYRSGTSGAPNVTTDLLGVTRSGTWDRGCYQDA